MKENSGKGKKQWILSSTLCLLPLFVSAMVYQKLPEQMAVHWNMAGEANRFVPKAIGAWAVPVLLLGLHLAVVIRAEHGFKEGQAARMTKLFSCGQFRRSRC